MHKNQGKHDATYRDKRQAKGEVQVTVWVPEPRKAEIRSIAKAMREKATSKDS